MNVDVQTIERWVKDGILRWDKFDHKVRLLFAKETVEEFAARFNSRRDATIPVAGFMPARIQFSKIRSNSTMDNNNTNNLTIQARIKGAEKFFGILYHDLPSPTLGYIWEKNCKATYWYNVASEELADMAAAAIDLNDAGADVYHGVNCSETQPETGRLKIADVDFQTAVIADVDIAGAAHKGTNLVASFDEARACLPFTPSIIIDSGYGMHAYYLFDTPLAITDDNRKEASERNKKLLDAMRLKSGGKKIDAVDDLARILRTPYTFNYKLGTDNPPMCHVASYKENLRFTPVEIDARLAEIMPPPKIFDCKPATTADVQIKPSRSATTDYPVDTPEYDLWRAERMLDVLKTVNHTQIDYTEWLSVQSACKALGVPYSVVDAFNQCDPTNYDADANLKRWEGLQTAGYGIQTIHALAQRFGYSEYDAKKEWYRLHPELSTRSTKHTDAADVTTETPKGKPAQIFTYRDFLKGTADQGNARRLMKFIDGAARWLKDVERWLIWEPTPEFKSGGVWRKYSKEHSAVSPFASKFADFLAEQRGIIKRDNKELHDRAYERIDNVFHVKDEAAAEQYKKALETEEIVEKIYKNFCSANKVSAAITMLKAQESIRITADDLDRHPKLLNVKNGVIDLETGKLYPADPSLYLTQMCSVDFDDRADFSFVQEFFAQIQPDEMTRAGLLRWLGYCLTGSICEEKFLVWLGKSGANGKGVLSKSISSLLDGYATSMPRRALIFNKFANGDSHTAGLNSLPGARFAISEELAQNLVLDSALIKTLTGGDMQAFRQLYSEVEVTNLVAKINMSSNFLPKFENVDDGGLQRRLLVMPFDQIFTGERANPKLKEQMLTPENQRGLLRLLVTEATAWYRGGLIISDQMTNARKDSLDANDFIADFLSEYTETHEGGQITRKALLEKLRAQCSDARRFNDRELTAMVKARGIDYREGKKGFFFSGIRLISDSNHG